MREDRGLLLDNASSRSPKFAYFNRINLMRAETTIIRVLIDCRLIKIATQMIEAEHSALHAAFEQASSEELVQALHIGAMGKPVHFLLARFAYS